MSTKLKYFNSSWVFSHSVQGCHLDKADEHHPSKEMH